MALEIGNVFLPFSANALKAQRVSQYRVAGKSTAHKQKARRKAGLFEIGSDPSDPSP